MKSYFFIPANKKEFLLKANKIYASEIVIDLEDAIFNSDVEIAANNIVSLNVPIDYWIRITYLNTASQTQFSYLDKILKKGFRKYIVPKVSNLEELRDILNYFISKNFNLSDFRLIVLVENPKAILNLHSILQEEQVIGIGVGSHDYCDNLGMEHTLENLYWMRMQMLNTAKSFGKKIIDIASMNIDNESEFTLECKDGLKKGFDGKFIIHPWQLDIFNSIEQYSKAEVEFAKLVKKYIDEIGGKDKFSIAKISGKVVEKPHLNRFNEILRSTGYETF